MTDQDFSDILIATWPAPVNSALKSWMCTAARHMSEITVRQELCMFLESAWLSDEERDRLIQDGRARRDVWERHEFRLEQAKHDAIWDESLEPTREEGATW